MGETLIEAAVDYAERGIRIFPLWGVRPDGSCYCPDVGCPSPGKHPHSRLAPRGLKDATDDPDTVASWWRQAPDCNIGLVTGEAFFVIDGDKKDATDGTALFLQMAEEHGGLPKTTAADTGGGGAHFLFAMDDDVQVRNQQAMRVGQDRVTGIDVRGTGGYIVAPPSLHKSGKRYTWARDLDHLKAAPYWLLELVGDSAPPTPVTVTRVTTCDRPVTDSELEQIQLALALIPPDTDRQTWLERITMPLHDIFGGSEAGFAVFHEWSSTGAGMTTPNGNPAYVSEADCRTQWRSLNTLHRNPKGPATFWQFARECGYAPPIATNGTSQPPATVPTWTPPPQFCAEELALAFAGPRNPGPFPASVVMSLEGPIKDLVSWIIDASRRPDPTIALAAAMSVTAAAVGRRVVGPGGARCTLTMACLAPSGAGKDKPQECVKNLLAMHPDVQVGVFDDSPTHRTQLDEVLLTSKGQALMLLDEYGSTLKRWLSDKDTASSTMSPVIRRLAAHGMSSYGLASVSPRHPSRMKHGAAWDAGIFAPTLSLCGFTTPRQFYDALSEASLSDGFLGRHVIIVSSTTEFLRDPIASSIEPPESVKRWMQSVIAVPVPKVTPKSIFQPNVNAPTRDLTPSDPIDVPWDSDAVQESWRVMSRALDVEGIKAVKKDDEGLTAILRRLPGQISIVALVFAIGEADELRGARVTQRHLDLAYRVAKWSADNIIWRLRMGVAKDDFGRAYIYACEHIEKKAPGKVYLSHFVRRAGTTTYAARIWGTLKEDPRFVVEGKAAWLRVGEG